tara:strand:- start:1143 stop:1271 length:129 start_codon:yes stop_codon:yes gene_type:complete
VSDASTQNAVVMSVGDQGVLPKAFALRPAVKLPVTVDIKGIY